MPAAALAAAVALAAAAAALVVADSKQPDIAAAAAAAAADNVAAVAVADVFIHEEGKRFYCQRINVLQEISSCTNDVNVKEPLLRARIRTTYDRKKKVTKRDGWVGKNREQVGISQR